MTRAEHWPSAAPGNRSGPGSVWIVLGGLLLLGCAGAPSVDSEGDRMEYLETLSELETEGPGVEPGSEAERQAIDRVKGLLSDFKAEGFRDRVREVYAEDAFFNDTLKTVRGADAIEEYLGETADGIDKGTVEFLDVVSDSGNHYFRWLMTIQFKKFDRGEDKTSIGMTHIRFDADGKVALHQDYWDSASGLFEHVPVVGWMIRRIKGRL